MSRLAGGLIQVMLSLRSAPRLGKNLVEPKMHESRLSDDAPVVTFDIDAQRLHNLYKALENRSLVRHTWYIK